MAWRVEGGSEPRFQKLPTYAWFFQKLSPRGRRKRNWNREKKKEKDHVGGEESREKYEIKQRSEEIKEIV